VRAKHEVHVLFARRALTLLLLPGLLATLPAHAQQPEDVVIALKIVRAEVQTLPADQALLASGRAVRVREALLLKTAVAGRDIERFTPARQPLLWIGGRYYPILRQQPDNWDLKKERRVDPDKPVGRVHYFFFLIPDWKKLPEGAQPLLAVSRRGAPPERVPKPSPVLAAVPGTARFSHKLVIHSK